VVQCHLRLVFTGVGVQVWWEVQSDTISGKSNQQSQKWNTDSASDSVAYDLVKTRLSEWQAEAEE